MPREKAYRKYQLTINNPLEHGFSHEVISGAIGHKRIGKNIRIPKVCVVDYLNSARYTVASR